MKTKRKLAKRWLVAISFALLIGVAYHFITLWITQPNKREWACMHYFNSTGSGHESCPPIIRLTEEPGKIKAGITIMTKAEGYEKVKWIGKRRRLDDDENYENYKYFALTKDAYEEVKKKHSLSREVDKFLASSVVSDLEMKEWTCVLWPKKIIDHPLLKGYAIIQDEGCPPLIALDFTFLKVDAYSLRTRILSKTEGIEKIKKSHDRLSITKEVYEEIKVNVPLSDEVDRYLAERVVSEKEIIKLTCFSRAFSPKELPFQIVTNPPCPSVISFNKTPGKVMSLGSTEIVANTENSMPFVENSIAAGNFFITREIYEEVKAATTLSKEADEFLASVVNDEEII